jgi:uncharacterized glyoxalase superfamily protein PhnB
MFSNPTPPGWPRISSSPVYIYASRAIEFLHRAFGFEVRRCFKDGSGLITHAELTFGEGLIVISSSILGENYQVSPGLTGGKNTQTMAVFVDDVDAHCERARAAGATIVHELKTTDYGEDYWIDRAYEAVDPEGHHWRFVQRLKTGKG